MLKPFRVRPRHAVLALLAATGMLVSACSSSTGTTGTGDTSSATQSSGGGTSSAVSSSSAAPTPKAKPKKPVHIKLLNSDGAKFGVGMPEIAYFSKKITNGKPLQDATTVTVNGKPAKGAWDFEYSSAYKHYPIEGHFRLQKYWPAHSKIHIAIPAKGLSAGGDMAYSDSLTNDWSTGPSHIATVDDSSHMLTLVTDGKKEGSYPVSLGATSTPTRRGTKVIMEKGLSICMSGPGYSECGVKDTQRLTYDGEYLHSAPWNTSNIASGVDSSNGCTNLDPSDAEHLFSLLRIGDVVTYPNANGPQMRFGDGYGDWNVSWSTWQTGGVAPTT